ncbi:hypothetical protein MCOR13_008690 [Pyricularia oryzae]|nr:hypothetical protein MCOR13_008690 [Pyricularia oryzae]
MILPRYLSLDDIQCPTGTLGISGIIQVETEFHAYNRIAHPTYPAAAMMKYFNLLGSSWLNVSRAMTSEDNAIGPLGPDTRPSNGSPHVVCDEVNGVSRATSLYWSSIAVQALKRSCEFHDGGLLSLEAKTANSNCPLGNANIMSAQDASSAWRVKIDDLHAFSKPPRPATHGSDCRLTHGTTARRRSLSSLGHQQRAVD